MNHSCEHIIIVGIIYGNNNRLDNFERKIDNWDCCGKFAFYVVKYIKKIKRALTNKSKYEQNIVIEWVPYTSMINTLVHFITLDMYGLITN